MRTRINTSRRRFLKRSAALAGAAAGAQLFGVPNILKARAPNEKLGVAVVGCGNMGSYSTQQALKENFVAIADVDDNTVARTMKETVRDQAKPRIFADYRTMLDECQKDVDVVLIATPDHQHAPAAIRAIQLGKHVFVQKPLAHNIRECRVLAEAAAKAKVHSQMGNQGHVTGEGYRQLCEYLWSGTLGNIVETHTILGRNFGGSGGRPSSQPIPAGVHWDEWIGPAPYRDYHTGLHPFNWRNWRAFGTGTLGDMACHLMDGVFSALRVGEAKNCTIECVSQTAGSEEKFSTNNVLRWDIPARSGMSASKVFAYDNAQNKAPALRDLDAKYNQQRYSTCYVTDKDLVLYTTGYGDRLIILPNEKKEGIPVPEKKIPRPTARGPIEDLYQAIRGGSAPVANFNYAGPFTEFILSGQLAMLAGPGKKLEWDAAAMKCTNVPDLNQYVQRPYRKGWEV
jgi:predicted dehydrogenase